MKRFAFHVILLATALLTFAEALSAQVSTGAPPFSTIEGGPFDAVNLGNLNVHFSVPILHKAGRGIPFAYDLSYDNSIWTPVTSGGVTSWKPVTNWGWIASTGSGTGFVSFTETDTFPIPNCQRSTYTKYVYHDSVGASHPFNGTAQWQFGIGGHSCTDIFTGFTSTASDSSGYTITVSSVSGNGTLRSKSGALITAPFNSEGGSASIVDANGNEITANTSNQFFDTLSSTSAVLTTSGSGTPASPINYQYTSPAGSKQYSAIYTAYTVQTNFGCTTQEYPATSNNLVSEIDLPDGSKYLFAYETTPGDAHNPHYVTGRISQVTLPTRGSIQYTYTGANDGINCADASTLSLQRVVTPGGTWTYLRSGSGSDWTTTVTDPASNQTAINFEKDSAATPSTNNFYETQRKAYQGTTSGTFMSTTINCYNGQSIGAPTSCYNTPVLSPIRRVTTFKYLPNSQQPTTPSENETDSTYDQFGLINEVDEYDYGSNAVGNLIRKTITAYQGGMSNGIVDRPSSVTIKDSGNAIQSVTSYLYDEGTLATPGGTTPQHLTITGSRGNLTTVNAQANGTTHLYRKYAYYNTGIFSTSTDVSTSSTTNGATTTYNYNSTGNADCGNAFVTSISEPVGSMSRSFSWDCNGGVLLSVTDENSKTSSTAYTGTNYTNVFWRPYSTTDEAGTVTDYWYYLNTATPPIEFQTESKYHTTFNGGNSTVDKVTTSDGFGRTTFSQTKQGPSLSTYDTVATCYDNFGRSNFTSLPYSAAIAASTTTCPSTNSGTTTTYDALGRTYQLTDTAMGSTTFSYNANDTTETRTSPTISKQSEYDGLGRLKSVCEINSGTTAWPSAFCSQSTTATGYLTTYGYDVLGNLTSPEQPGIERSPDTRLRL
jgi:hypothetical protein